MKRVLIPAVCLGIGVAIGVPIGAHTYKVKGYRSCVLTYVRPGLSDYSIRLIEETCRGMFPPKTSP